MIEVCSAPSHLDYHDLDAVRRAAARIDELGMESYSFHAPFANHIDISSLDLDQRKLAAAELLQAAEAAATLQVHYLVVHPGPERDLHLPREERLERMENAVGVLNTVAARCHELGIVCVLENKLPHLLFGNTSDILWMLDAMSSIETGACLDTGHAYLSGDLSNLVHKLSGHLKMVHAHDNSGKFDDHKPPGDGVIDWEALLGQLVTIGFHGGFILEMAGGTDSGVTLANARRGRSFVRRLSRRLALPRRHSSPL